MRDFCLFACSDQFDLPEKGAQFLEVTLNLCQQLGVEITHYFYTLDPKENLPNLSREGKLTLNGKNLLIKALTEKPIKELVLWSDYPEHEYYEFKTEIINTGPFNRYKYVYLELPMDYINRLETTFLFVLVNKLLYDWNQIGQLDYALVTEMDSSLPSTYFSNIFTDDLNKEQALDIATWITNLNERRKKIRGVYWGNLLGPGHLSQANDKMAFISHLETLMKGSKITVIDNKSLFFMFSSPDISNDPIAKEVKSFLKNQNFLMEGDEVAMAMIKPYMHLWKAEDQ